MFDAGNPIINKILEKLINNEIIKGLLIFGSRSNNTYTDKSDVDLLLLTDEKLNGIEVLHPVITELKIRFDVWIRSSAALENVLKEMKNQNCNENSFVINAIRTGIILKDYKKLLSRIKEAISNKKIKEKVKVNPNMIRFKLTHAYESLINLKSFPLCFEIMYILEIVSSIYEYAKIKKIKEESLKKILSIYKKITPKFYIDIENAIKIRKPDDKIDALSKLQDHVLKKFNGRLSENEFIATGNMDLNPKQQNKLGLKFWNKIISE
jgi:predicted nucleotidyltransferase